MNILTLLHVLVVFVAFGFTTGVGIVLSAITSAGDVRTIRIASRVALPFLIAGAVTLVLGVLLGFGTATQSGFSLTSTWLIVTYVAAGLLILVGFGIHLPWRAKIAAASAASPDDKPSSELSSVIRDPLARAAAPVSGILWIVIISMMVLKPG